MNVFIANEQDVPLDLTTLSRLASHALVSDNVSEGAELSVLFVSPEHIRRLNARYAGDDYATDVLAFPMMEDDDDSLLLGDVVVCPAVAGENAAKLGHETSAEIETVLVHGILHLMGYDHQGEEDRARMEKRMNEVLGSFERAPA